MQFYCKINIFYGVIPYHSHGIAIIALNACYAPIQQERDRVPSEQPQHHLQLQST
jgi:hypothetical protein